MHLQDGDGSISSSEFKHALERAMPGTHIADAQIRQLVRSIDTDGDGLIQYNEFVAKFGLQEKPTNTSSNEEMI